MNGSSLLTGINRELDITRLPILILREHSLECNCLTNASKSEDDRTNLYKRVSYNQREQATHEGAKHSLELTPFR